MVGENIWPKMNLVASTLVRRRSSPSVERRTRKMTTRNGTMRAVTKRGMICVTRPGLRQRALRDAEGRRATHLEGPKDGDDDEQCEAVLLLDAVEPLAAQDDAKQEERDRRRDGLPVDPAREAQLAEGRADLGGLELEAAGRTRRLHDRETRRRACRSAAPPSRAGVPARGRPAAPLEADHLAPDRVALPHDVLAQVRLELLEREVDVAARCEVGVERDDGLDARLQALLSCALKGEGVVDDGRHVVLAKR